MFTPFGPIIITVYEYIQNDTRSMSRFVKYSQLSKIKVLLRYFFPDNNRTKMLTTFTTSLSNQVNRFQYTGYSQSPTYPSVRQTEVTHRPPLLRSLGPWA